MVILVTSLTVLPVFKRDLRFCSVVIKARHCSEIAGVNIGCIALSDQRIGVGRVADNQYFNISAGMVVNGFALHREDGSISL